MAFDDSIPDTAVDGDSSSRPESTVSLRGCNERDSIEISLATPMDVRATELPETFGGVDAPPESNDSLENQLPIGQLLLERYEIRERLGRGGFGSVYLAFDRHLNREVAIKQSRVLRSFVSGQVREEARAIASLNHPNIVQIHDLIQRSENEWLIIMECLKGIPLSQRLRQSRPSIVEAVRHAVEIADALVHAHERHLVHSDLKPGNLFLCETGRIKLLDFGLAVAHFPDQDKTRIGGTPGYMSPEQIRGESHLIDGRTDVWAFGVVMYEMLTGARPFSAKDAQTTNARTLFKLAPPPRQFNPEIDNELQRIMLKCLEPLITSRYGSVAQLREDLLHWLQDYGNEASATSSAATKSLLLNDAVPSSLRLSNRGLQPFIEADASVYLAVIPGPRDRNGIPDSIRFWNRWVESDDPHTEHPVGVLYGPSGSGKTSFVRAGLFQQLGPEICRVYVECRPGDLGGRLTRIIEAQINNPSGESSLRDLLLRLRSGDSSSLGFRKLLIILDQFESWAHSATLEERMDLAEALRQCDGIQIRALVVTRDDYWMGVKELLHWLEIPMREGRNVASVDLLNRHQAEQILESIGRESGTLPPEDQALTKDQSQFISQSVSELAIDGKIICVHLVMFAQMVKLSQWTPRALRDSGGVIGACSLFFHELFGKSGGHSPEFNRVAPAVPVVLGKLIPKQTDSVAEDCVDHESLAEALRDIGQSHLLADCLRVLCEELRIITVVGTDPIPTGTSRRNRTINHQYRLSHDFLVEPINAYLTRVRKKTWRSRTMTRLSEMSDLWTRRPNNAYLPGFIEYLMLAIGTVFQPHAEAESRFLRAATRMHAGRISVAIIGLLGFLFMSVIAWNQWNAATIAKQAELNARVARLLDCPANDFASTMTALRAFGRQSLESVDAWRASPDIDKQLRSQLYSQSILRESFSQIAPLLGQAPPAFFQTALAIAQITPDATAVLRPLAEMQPMVQSAVEGDAVGDPVGNRASILLAYLGDPSTLVQRLGGSNDLTKDQAFFSDVMLWRGTPNLWADLVRNSADPNVRYGAAVVLASYPTQELLATDLQLDYRSLINSSDAATHSMGRFLANKLGESAFSVPLQPPPGANWRVGPEQTPMVRFEPQTFEFHPRQMQVEKEKLPNESLVVQRSFWFSTIPVSEGMYQQFAADLINQNSDFETNRSLDRFVLPDYLINDPNQPAVGVSLAQAYMYCNWLSRREGLQPCYAPRDVAPNPDPSFNYPPIPWAFDENADGFRVATSEEFKLVALSGYKTANSRLAIEIAVATEKARTTPVHPRELFSLIPNRSGIFLMDQFCGTWICGDEMITSFILTENGLIKGLQRELSVPVGGIFLVQTADRSLDPSQTSDPK